MPIMITYHNHLYLRSGWLDVHLKMDVQKRRALVRLDMCSKKFIYSRLNNEHDCVLKKGGGHLVALRL